MVLSSAYHARRLINTAAALMAFVSEHWAVRCNDTHVLSAVDWHVFRIRHLCGDLKQVGVRKETVEALLEQQ